MSRDRPELSPETGHSSAHQRVRRRTRGVTMGWQLAPGRFECSLPWEDAGFLAW